MWCPPASCLQAKTLLLAIPSKAKSTAQKEKIYLQCTVDGSGQIISRPHEPTEKTPQKGSGFWKRNGTPKISGEYRLVKYYFIWLDGLDMRLTTWDFLKARRKEWDFSIF